MFTCLKCRTKTNYSIAPPSLLGTFVVMKNVEGESSYRRVSVVQYCIMYEGVSGQVTKAIIQTKGPWWQADARCAPPL